MTAIVGGVFGFLLAYAVILGGLPNVLRDALMTFSGVASNFAGVPLALAFIFTLGQLGVLTLWLKGFGINLVCLRLHDLQQVRTRDRLSVLPVPAHGPDHRAGHRRPPAGVA